MPEEFSRGWENISGASVASERQEKLLRASADHHYLLRLPHQTFRGTKRITTPLEVGESMDGGRRWRPVPLRLDVRSYLRFASPLHRHRWPPELIFACGIIEGQLALKFLDLGIMCDLPYSQTDSNRETDWLARYWQDRRRWTLQPLDTHWPQG